MPALRRLVVMIFAVSSVIACTESKAPDLEVARREVAAASKAWASAAAAHNLDSSVNALAEDGMMLPPDEAPVVGRAAVRQYMAGALAIPGFRVEWEPGDIHVANSGELAYEYGQSRYTFPDSAGKLHTTPAKGIVIWRRQPDGNWRVVADIWNGAPK